MTAVDVLVVLLMLVGLAGTVVPMLPGTPLILAGALLHALATGFTPIGYGRLAVLAALAVVGVAAGQVATAAGVRRAGGTGWAVAGALVGVVVGMFTAPVGLLVGPLVGAVVGQVLATRRLQGSVQAGVGAAVGVILGAAAQAAVAVVMIALFGWWLWRG